jgi:hypothetical protein
MDSANKKKSKGKIKGSVDDSEVYSRNIKDEIMSLEEEEVVNVSFLIIWEISVNFIFLSGLKFEIL